MTEERDTDGYGSSDAVERYREKALRQGLFDVEAAIVDEYFVEEDASVLDLGCGAGRTTKPLADRGFDVIGVDRSEPMIEAARKTYPDIPFRVEDARNLSAPDGTYEYVLFSNNGLDYVHPASGRVRALREIRRVLRPGGMVAFSSRNWLYVVPAIVSDFEHVGRYYLANGNPSRMFSPYKKDPEEFDVFVYLGAPWHTKAHLENSGFNLLDWVTKRHNPLKYFEVDHHYVGQAVGSS